MTRIAIIEDDPPTSDQLRGWIQAARPGVQIEQWFNRDDAQAAIERETYDLVVLDIELGRERHAGVALINAINKRGGTPVLVVSAMPAAIYRSIMRALDAWDYLQKTTFSESDFIETLLDILRSTAHKQIANNVAATSISIATSTPLPAATTAFTPPSPPPAAAGELSIDPLRQGAALWRGQKINLPLTAQRILATLYARRGDVVSYDELYQVVKSGRNRDNIRKHISAIREAFRELDAGFDAIENIPMRGFRWADPR